MWVWMSEIVLTFKRVLKLSFAYFPEIAMHVQPKPTAFDDFYHLLSQAEVMTSPAEIHGVLCGFICVGNKLNGEFSIDILLQRLGGRTPDVEMGPQGGALVGLYDVACRQLSGLQSFELLLPKPQQALSIRAEALSLWCEGFLYGLSFLGGMLEEELSESVSEALHCIAEIARLDVSQFEVSELDKKAYEEALDFVTQAIPLIHEELIQAVEQKGSGSPLH